MRWLAGYFKISIPKEKCADFFNLCMRYGFVYWGFYVNEERAFFNCSLFTARKLLYACGIYKIEAKTQGKYGFPLLLYRYRLRAGLLIGALLAFIIVMLSDNVLWKIDIVGNERLSEESVLEELEENGFSIGKSLKDFDIDSIENRVLINSDEISWIAINLSGTVANVEIRERIDTSKEEVNKHPANLVAKCDAEIVEVQAYTGFVCVKAGDFVREGDLLVSGLYDSNVYPYRYTRASGRILARTKHTFSVEIPFETEEKVYIKGVKEKKTLNFFGKSIKLFLNYGKNGDSCDIMNYEYHLNPFGLGKLPISIVTTEERPYIMKKRILSENEAGERAFALIDERIKEEIPNSQLLKKNIEVEITDDKYILYCTVWCIEDIAKISEFEIKG